MKVIVAIDSFKGTLSSLDLAKLVCTHLKELNHQVTIIPISDGGEGFLNSISSYYGIDVLEVDSFGPLMDQLRGEYLMRNQTAYLELNSTSGISKIRENRMNPMITTTFGLGIIIKHVIDLGAKKIVIGLGGSATNDGGAGMLQALGVKFYQQGKELLEPMNGETIGLVDSLDSTLLEKYIQGIEFEIASDVKNPLLGKLGAVNVYATQKGATNDQKIILEQNMNNYADVVESHLSNSYRYLDGSGSAGGVGFASLALLKANLYSGIDFLINLIQLENLIMHSDVVVVGEGKLDLQTRFGKAPFGIALLAKKYNKKVIGIFGSSDVDDVSDFLDCVYSVVPFYATSEESIAQPKFYIEKLIEDIVI